MPSTARHAATLYPERMDGILAIDKPKGLTSHDVVARVRRLSGQRRIGHAGTLDPHATGVLLLCLGEATRLSDQLMDSVKWYLARLAFGISTETDDAEGRVIAQSEPAFSLDNVQQALHSQLGVLQQIPPRYAAIKRDGVPAYRMARAGQAVELSPRAVTVFALALLRTLDADLTLSTDAGPTYLRLPSADILVCCSKGTYIRSLARDVGESLGCGGYLAGLRRLASGSFTTRHCIPLDDLERRVLEAGPEAVRAALTPPDAALDRWPAAVVGEALRERVQCGVSVPLPVSGDALRIYSSGGDLIALGERTAEEADAEAGLSHHWHPAKVFRWREA